MPDVEFESTFANLASAQLGKIPALAPYRVGFQTIEKNEDETKAIGVFGFKVGNQWIYAPVFFDNGEIKGHELLYLKDQDIFVPARENWVNYLINRKPYLLGEPEKREEGELGLQPPDLAIFRGAPIKTGSYNLRDIAKRVEGYVRPFLPVFDVSPRDDRYKAAESRTELITFVRDVGKPAAELLLELMESNTKFANAILRFHTMDEITQAVQDVIEKSAADDDEKIENTAPDVVVVVHGDEDLSSELDTLTDAEKERLLQDQIVVRDNRDDGQQSNVYRPPIVYASYAKSLTNPTETGMYEVLLRPNRFRNCFVLCGPVQFKQNPIESFSVLLSPEDKAFCNAEEHAIFSKKCLIDKYNEAVEDLPDADTMQAQKCYALLGPKGTCSVVFRVVNRKADSNGVVRFCVDPISCIHHRGGFARNDHEVRLNRASDPDYYMPEQPIRCDRTIADEQPQEYDPEKEKTRCPGYHVTLTGKDGLSLFYQNAELFVPNGYKVIQVNSEYSQLDPGNAADVEMEILKTAAEAEVNPEVGNVRIYNDGVYFHVTANGETWEGMSKRATAGHLILRQGVTLDDAKAMLSLPNKTAGKYIVKYAQGYPAPLGPGPAAPAIPEPTTGMDPWLGVPAQYPLERTEIVPGMIPQQGRRREQVWPDDDVHRTVNEATEAARTGQREIFDTSVVGSLVRQVDMEGVVDRYLADLIQGLDRVGRILFLLYWHRDQFKERYGEQDLPELEDNLRNVFKNLGDLVLFLKQKTIEPEPMETAEAELKELPTG